MNANYVNTTVIGKINLLHTSYRHMKKEDMNVKHVHTKHLVKQGLLIISTYYSVFFIWFRAPNKFILFILFGVIGTLLVILSQWENANIRIPYKSYVI